MYDIHNQSMSSQTRSFINREIVHAIKIVMSGGSIVTLGNVVTSAAKRLLETSLNGVLGIEYTRALVQQEIMVHIRKGNLWAHIRANDYSSDIYLKRPSGEYASADYLYFYNVCGTAEKLDD